MSKDAEGKIVARGGARTIEYAVAANGSSPAEAFVEGLSPGDHAKLLALLKRMADHGTIPNREQFKKIRGKIFEFKKHQIRVFCFQEGNRWLLTNGYLKQKDRLHRGEIDRAERIMAEHQDRDRRKPGGQQR